MIELIGPVVQRRDVGIHIRVLADGHHGLAFVRMAQVRHYDPHLGEACRNVVDQPRHGAIERRLRDALTASQHVQASLLLVEMVGRHIIGTDNVVTLI